MARYKLAYLHPAETDILGIVRFHAEQVGAMSAREIYRSIPARRAASAARMLARCASIFSRSSYASMLI